MAWLKLIITSDQQNAEHIADLLAEFCGAEAVTLTAQSEEEVFQLQPDDSPLWQQTEVHALYKLDTDIEPIIKKLMLLLQADKLNYKTEELADEDWVRKTQENFPPINIDDIILVSPSWHDANNFPGKVVKIDPGLAFGTGTHPTTALCLDWLAHQNMQNKTIIDYGCGSGILALATDALGADCIYATDHDTQAIEATNNNLKLNQQQSEAFTVCLAKNFPNVMADIVIANILANPLLELAELLAKLTKQGGQIILSGILAEEEQLITNKYATYFDITEVTAQNGWLRIIGSKRTLQ